jgi:hypothetical protein
LKIREKLKRFLSGKNCSKIKAASLCHANEQSEIKYPVHKTYVANAYKAGGGSA